VSEASPSGGPPAGKTRWIRQFRGAKNPVDPWKPYAFFVEDEYGAAADPPSYAILLITNRECPFTCLMCDLWKNTLDEEVPEGAIVHQMRHALGSLPPVEGLKLYNAGSFFDPRAIPPGELEGIAAICRNYRRTVVECHPAFINDSCFRFHDAIGGTLEVAIGLETVHPQVLPRLNKEMTLESIEKKVRCLHREGIRTRAFILLKPPGLDEAEGIHWALETLRFAQDRGISTSVLIPTRGGNGAMEKLAEEGLFASPALESLECVLACALEERKGRIFADTWDLEAFPACPQCRPHRIRNIEEMNLTQEPSPPTRCPHPR